MDKYKSYKGTEFDGVEGAAVQKAAQLIKSKLDQKRNYYHQLRNQMFLGENWDEFNDKVTEFDNLKFAPWNQEWSKIHRSNDVNQFKPFFESGAEMFAEMDEFANSIRVTVNSSEEIEVLKSDILKKIENDLLNLKTDVSVQIENGIKDLVGLKAELGLQKNYKENIDNELSRSTMYRKLFLAAFVASVVVIPLFLGVTFVFDKIQSLPYSELMFLRASVTISAAILSYFFYTQYKLYQLMSLRYSHLNGFIGGGATFINQIIGSEDTDVNRRMADLFMEQEDVFGLVKKSQHPVEISLDKAGDVLDKISDLTSKITRGASGGS